MTEDAPAGTDFMADVCRVWEAAARPAEDAGVRVVLLRTGLPLDEHGGLLKPQMLPFRLGVGGKIGGGKQWVPWIAMQDWLRAVEFLLERDDIAGPVNVVGPEPVTNADVHRGVRPVAAPADGDADPRLALQVASAGSPVRR